MASFIEQTVYIIGTPKNWIGSKFENKLKESADILDIPVIIRRMPGSDQILSIYFYRRNDARSTFNDLIKKGIINSGTSCDMDTTRIQYTEV